jgi:hypothetical protein
MLLSALCRALRRGLRRASRDRRRTFPPRLEALEDRLVPSGAGSSGSHTTVVGNGTIWDIPDYYAQLSPAIKSTLGAVVAPETKTSDGFGSYELFQNGAIYCSNFTGAHALYGGIYQKWLSMRWDRDATNRKGGLERTLYYPSTDITSLTNGDSCAHFLAYNPWERQNDVAVIDDVGVWARPKVNPLKPTEYFTASAVYGPIAQKLESLGWEDWGEALTDVAVAPDWKGQYVHFQRPTNSGVPAFEAIDWTPDYGAHDVNWLNGWEFSYLGAEKFGEAISDTAATPDRQGESNHFAKYVSGRLTSFAAIDWTSQYGSHAVQGAIAQKFKDLNWEQFGEAITDETTSGDGHARYNHFLYGDQRKAIDSTREDGAHAVDGAIADTFFDSGAEGAFGEAITDTIPYHQNDLTGSYMHFGYWDGYEFEPLYIDSSLYGTFAVGGSAAADFHALGEESGLGLASYWGYTKGAEYWWFQTAQDKTAAWSNYSLIILSAAGAHEMDGQVYQKWSDPNVNPWVVTRNGLWDIVSGGQLGYPTSDTKRIPDQAPEPASYCNPNLTCTFYHPTEDLSSQFQHGAIQWDQDQSPDWLWVVQSGDSNKFTLHWSGPYSAYNFWVSDQAGQETDTRDWEVKSTGSWDFVLNANTTYLFTVDSLIAYTTDTFGNKSNCKWSGWVTPLVFTTGAVNPTPPPNQSGGIVGPIIVFGSPLTYDGPAPTAGQGITLTWADKNIGDLVTGGPGSGWNPDGDDSFNKDEYTDVVVLSPTMNNEDFNNGEFDPANYDGKLGWHSDGAGLQTTVQGAALVPGDTNDQRVDIPGLPPGDYTVDVELPNDFQEMHVHVLENPDGQGQAPAPRQAAHLPSLLAALPLGRPAPTSRPAVDAVVAVAATPGSKSAPARLAVVSDSHSAATAAPQVPDAGVTVAARDVTAQLAISVVRSTLDPTTRRYEQTVTIKNTSSTPVVGPLSLVLDHLSGNATLVNKPGVTARWAPSSSPYIDATLVSDVLDPGTSVTILLAFTDLSDQPITYTTRVLAGTGHR